MITYRQKQNNCLLFFQWNIACMSVSVRWCGSRIQWVKRNWQTNLGLEMAVHTLEVDLYWILWFEYVDVARPFLVCGLLGHDLFLQEEALQGPSAIMQNGTRHAHKKNKKRPKNTNYIVPRTNWVITEIGALYTTPVGHSAGVLFNQSRTPFLCVELKLTSSWLLMAKRLAQNSGFAPTKQARATSWMPTMQHVMSCAHHWDQGTPSWQNTQKMCTETKKEASISVWPGVPPWVGHHCCPWARKVAKCQRQNFLELRHMKQFIESQFNKSFSNWRLLPKNAFGTQKREVSPEHWVFVVETAETRRRENRRNTPPSRWHIWEHAFLLCRCFVAACKDVHDGWSSCCVLSWIDSRSLSPHCTKQLMPHSFSLGSVRRCERK